MDGSKSLREYVFDLLAKDDQELESALVLMNSNMNSWSCQGARTKLRTRATIAASPVISAKSSLDCWEMTAIARLKLIGIRKNKDIVGTVNLEKLGSIGR